MIQRPPLTDAICDFANPSAAEACGWICPSMPACRLQCAKGQLRRLHQRTKTVAIRFWDHELSETNSVTPGWFAFSASTSPQAIQWLFLLEQSATQQDLDLTRG